MWINGDTTPKRSGCSFVEDEIGVGVGVGIVTGLAMLSGVDAAVAAAAAVIGCLVDSTSIEDKGTVGGETNADWSSIPTKF